MWTNEENYESEQLCGTLYTALTELENYKIAISNILSSDDFFFMISVLGKNHK